MARTAGWLAHWKEMIEDPEARITRPRQLYTGPTKRNYLDVAEREGRTPEPVFPSGPPMPGEVVVGG
jgi:citrate synthase